jgi:hypothetical protein
LSILAAIFFNRERERGRFSGSEDSRAFFGVVSIRCATSRARRSASSFVGWLTSRSVMPQPVRPLITINFAPEVILQRPEFAVHIALIAAKWTDIQVTLGHLLSKLTGSEGEAVTAIYLCLTSDSAKRASFEAAAAINLHDDSQRKEFAALMKYVGDRGKERNKIVHGMWGISDDYPGKMILIDPDDLVASLAVMEVHRRRIKGRKGGKRLQETGDAAFLGVARAMKNLQAKWSVYQTSDFEHIYNWRATRCLCSVTTSSGRGARLTV